MVKLFLGLAILFSSAQLFAGIKDKKQIKENKSKIEKKMTELKTKCGFAKTPNIKVNWFSWDGHDYSKIHVKKVEVLKNVGRLVVSIIDDISKLCGDEDYKAEIVKLKNISVDAKKELNSRYVDFTLEGSSLLVKLNLDGVGSWKNADRLKATWE